jgi:hypothetical protein
MLEPLIIHACKNCGHSFEGFYCNLCGEKVIQTKDRKFKSFMTTVMIATTFVDNKFAKSLWLTISNPGFLSREYVDGRRVRYMRPLQMFFILNLIYFLFPVLQMFKSSLKTQMYYLPHSKFVRSIVMDKILSEGLSLQGYGLMYDEKTTSLAKLLIVIFIILASVPMSLIFRKKNRYFTDHVAFSVELTCFNLAVNTIGLTLLFSLVNWILKLFDLGGKSYLNELTITIIVVSTNLYFIFRAAKTFYGQHSSMLILKAVGGILGLFLALEVYRLILFFITYWAI